MKKLTILPALILAACLMPLSGGASATECYAVRNAESSKVKTINVSPTAQVGTIRLDLVNGAGQRVFKEKGNLVGTVTSGGFGFTNLSHTANFAGSSFVTEGDLAIVTGIRAVDAQGIPCSFFIDETISHISTGTGIFSNVESVNIKADGYISFCPAENENQFSLSGEVCVGN